MRAGFLAGLILLASVTAASADAPSLKPADWRADLDTLYGAMQTIHPALHHKTSAAVMDAYAAKLRADIPHLTWPQYVMRLYGLMALVGDGHTTFFPQPDAGPGFDTRYPILPGVFADGVYVTAADAKYAAAVGGRIVAIGGHPIAQVFAAMREHWDHENDQWPLRWFPFALRRPGYLAGMGMIGDDVAAPALFTIEKDGARRDIAIAPLAADQVSTDDPGWTKARISEPTPLVDPGAPYGFVFLKEQGAVYAAYNQCSDGDKETVADFAARLFKFIDENPVDRLIIDVRRNGGGDNYKNQALLLGMIASRLNKPGHLFILTGSQTFSAAQNFAADAERWTQALFVGEPTGSSPNLWGDAKQFELPHTHLHPMVSTLYWQYSDPRDARVWILPDIPAPESFADYRAGRDPALEAALAFRPDPAAKPARPNARWHRKSQDAGWALPF